MKPMLTRADVSIFHYIDGVRVDGAHARISGNVSDLSGNVTDIRGDIDNCELTDDERQLGVSVVDLVMEQSAVEPV